MEEEIARGLASSVINKPFLEQTRRCSFPRGSPPPLLSTCGKEEERISISWPISPGTNYYSLSERPNLFIITDRKAKWDPGQDQDQASGDEP